MNDDPLLTQNQRQLAHDIFLRGLAEHQAGQLSGAQDLYREALRYDSLHAEAIHHLGGVEVQYSNYENALKLITESIQINPSNGVALKNRGLGQAIFG